MPIYGKRSHLGITYQQSFDQIPDFTSSAQMIPNVRHNIAVNRPHIIQENMRGIYDEGESYRGPHEVTGEIESEAHPITMGYMFDAFFGDATVTTSDNIHTHEWKPNTSPFDGVGGSSFKRPFGLIQQGVVVAGGATVNYYYNLVANTLELSVSEGELLKTKLTYMGGTDGENTDSYTETYLTSTERFSWDMCTISENHPISEFTVTFEDPIEPKYYLNTSVWPSKNVLSGRRRISFSGVMHYENNSYYQKFIDKDEVTLQLTIEDTATEIQSGYYNKMHLTIYKARIETVEANATGAGETMLSFSGNAHYSSAQAGNMSLTLTNTKSSY
jgi:hypothetical protein